MKKYIYLYLKFIALGCVFTSMSCTTTDDSTADTNAKFGSINVGSSTISRAAVDAVSNDWLKTVLSGEGISVTYGLMAKDSVTMLTEPTPNTVKLKYDTDKSQYKLWSDETSNIQAQWLGNGYHLFHSYYYPGALLTTNNFSAVDQSTADIYSNLEHYIIIPQKTNIYATIDKVNMPYMHRMARVQLDILIDDDVKTNENKTAITGYNSTTGGGSACALRINGVQVLSGIDANKNPAWTTVDKLIPHFKGEESSVTYNKKSFTNVPEFEFIVRPINLMYDDATSTTAMTENKISISLELDNGFKVQRNCDLKLKPNEQTILYIHISREKVDFSASVNENWITEYFYNDAYYGVDNDGFSLSDAGGSWQRAYQVGTSTLKISDGETYSDHQYLTNEQFISKLKEAKADGSCHGDYFVLTQDITLPAYWTPFEFTGHLDGRGKTIKFAEGGTATALFSSIKGNYETTTLGEANVHLENGTYVPIPGYRAEIMNVTMQPGKSLVSGDCTGYLLNNTVTSPGAICGSITDPGSQINCHTLIP